MELLRIKAKLAEAEAKKNKMIESADKDSGTFMLLIGKILAYKEILEILEADI